jgi:hypothetical protein
VETFLREYAKGQHNAGRIMDTHQAAVQEENDVRKKAGKNRSTRVLNKKYCACVDLRVLACSDGACHTGVPVNLVFCQCVQSEPMET